LSTEFEQDIEKCLQVLNAGGTILYPTDTVWGIGCDATNTSAVKKIYKIKNRDESKSMIILVADERDILKYIAAPDLAVFDYLQQQTRPTTIIFNGAIGLAENLISSDGSIAIRIVKDEFCRHLIKRFRKPLVSTSANISGDTAPHNFSQISGYIKNTVDYVVQWRQNDKSNSQPSQIIKWNADGTYKVIRS
jgi:L-threonylcarbamoyladenylate synthase